MVINEIKCKMENKACENEHLDGAIHDENIPVAEGAAEQTADNVSDESFESNDNSAQLTSEATEWKDKYLRLAAEFDNYRKRTLREKMELIASGGEDVVRSLLPVMDDIDRAVGAVEKAQDLNAVKEGVYLIRQKLNDALKAKGVFLIEAVGQDLDTDLHEAVAKIPVPDVQRGKIIDVVQQGYRMKDKVIRFAKVVVGE